MLKRIFFLSLFVFFSFSFPVFSESQMQIQNISERATYKKDAPTHKAFYSDFMDENSEFINKYVVNKEKVKVDLDELNEALYGVEDYEGSYKTVTGTTRQLHNFFLESFETEFNKAEEQGGVPGLKDNIFDLLDNLKLKIHNEKKDKSCKIRACKNDLEVSDELIRLSENETQNIKDKLEAIASQYTFFETIRNIGTNLINSKVPLPAMQAEASALPFTFDQAGLRRFMMDAGNRITGNVIIPNKYIIPIWLNSAEMHFQNAIAQNSSEEFQYGQNLINLAETQIHKWHQGFVVHVNPPVDPGLVESLMPYEPISGTSVYGDARQIYYDYYTGQYVWMVVDSTLALPIPGKIFVKGPLKASRKIIDKAGKNFGDVVRHGDTLEDIGEELVEKGGRNESIGKMLEQIGDKIEKAGKQAQKKADDLADYVDHKHQDIIDEENRPKDWWDDDVKGGLKKIPSELGVGLTLNEYRAKKKKEKYEKEKRKKEKWEKLKVEFPSQPQNTKNQQSIQIEVAKSQCSLDTLAKMPMEESMEHWENFCFE